MPKAVAKGNKIIYPPSCKEIVEDLGKDELVRRLKALARAFQEMGQDENNKYKGLALFLASETFMDHPSKDVRLLAACCIADVFRIFAPEAPYSDPGHLKEIFLFLTKQLRGLEDPSAASFKRYFYLLENLAWVKSFNICIELEENQEIFCNLYQLMFSIVNDRHSVKVTNFMLDMMCPLITEADSVSQELLDIILLNIIEPYKSQNPHCYSLAKDLIKRTANAIEPYIQTFFNNALMLGKTSESEVSDHLFELIYELNSISPSVLLAVLPQLEFKLKSNDEVERRAVTRLLARMFSDPESDLAHQNRPLWNCFLGRFNDIDTDVRRICVRSVQEFIVNHPYLVDDITGGGAPNILEFLNGRSRDNDENVRMDVVSAVVGAARKDMSKITDVLLELVRERTLDKKFKIRKEALQGLGHIFRKVHGQEVKETEDVKKVEWIKNKILHAYYHNIDDRLVVERLLCTCLVPYTLEPSERMKRLFLLYGSVDENAVKAIQELFKSQHTVRLAVRNLLEVHQKQDNENIDKMMHCRILQLSRYLPEPSKTLEYLRKFNKILKDDNRLRGYLIKMVHHDCTCKKAEEYVKDILNKLGNPTPANHLYTTVKILLERIAPVLIDEEAVKELLKLVEDAVVGLGEIEDEIKDASSKGMRVLLMLSHFHPTAFKCEDVYTQLLTFLKSDDDIVSDLTLQVFSKIGDGLSESFPNIYSSLLPILQSNAKIGTPKQAKHAIRCIHVLCKNKDKIFLQIFEHLKKSMDLESATFMTALVSLGHIAELCPNEFSTSVRSIVSRFLVKDLLMQDRGQCRPSNESWYADHLVTEETLLKIQAMKLMVRWLLGLKSNATNSGTSTLRLLHTLLVHEGDLMEKGKINKPEMARLRLCAGCCILKLAQEPCYSEIITQDQFQTVAWLINDPCYQVRLHFAQKLHKGLLTLRVPLQFMSIFSLAANDPMKERRAQIKQFCIANIIKRRECLKTNPVANAKLFSVLPDYVLPYCIHLLAHDPELKNIDQVDTLKNIRECLWFIMEPLITKNENYSYNFYRKMIENIKQTRDAQGPDSEEMNSKLYAVCDLAMGLVLTKTTNVVLKDFPAEPLLPAKLFTRPDQNYSNTKVYLPKELTVNLGKTKKGLQGLSGGSVLTPSTAAATAGSQNKTSPVSSSSGSGRQFSPTSQQNSSGSSSPSDPTHSTNRTKTAAFKSKSSENQPISRVAHQNGQSKKIQLKHTNTSATRGRKPSGKITDYVTKQKRTSDTNKESPSKSSKLHTSKSPSSASSSTDKNSSGRKTITNKTSKTNTGKSVSVRNSATVSQKSTGADLRNSPRRGSNTSSASSSPVKITKIQSATVTAAASLKRRAKNTVRPTARSATLQPSSDMESNDTTLPSSSSKSSPKKRGADSSPSPVPVKRKRGRPPKNAKSDDVIPSPSSSTSSPTTSPPKKKRGRPPGRKNNVRTAGSLMNGTSDGEEGASDSPGSMSPRKRTAALAKAVETAGLPPSDISAKRNVRNTRRR